MIAIRLKRLPHGEGLPLPAYATAGAAGMVAGQAFDIAAETAAEPLDLAAVTGLQGLKTGALIGWAAERATGRPFAPETLDDEVARQAHDAQVRRLLA